MRKWIIGFIVVAVLALFLFLPYTLGGIAQQYIVAWVDYANQSPNVNAKLVNYQRGWFRSRALVDVSVGALSEVGMMDEDVGLSLFETIHHGPLVFHKNRPRFALALVQSELHLPAIHRVETDGFLKSDVLLLWGQAMEADLLIPDFLAVSQDEETLFDWDGLEAFWWVSSGGGEQTTGLRFAGAKLVAEPVMFEVGTLALSYQQRQGHADGDSHIKFDMAFQGMDFTVEGMPEYNFWLDDLHANIQMALEDSLLSLLFTLQLKGGLFQQQEIRETYMDIEVNNVHVGALQALRNKWTSISHKQWWRSQDWAALMTLLPDISTVVNKGAEFTIKSFTVALPDGEIRAKGHVKFPETDNGWLSIFSVFANAEAEFSLGVSRAWIEAKLVEDYLTNYQRQQALQTTLLEHLQTEGADEGSMALDELAEALEVDGALSEETLAQQANAYAKNYLQSLSDEGFIDLNKKEIDVHFLYKNGSLLINNNELNILDLLSF